MFNVFLRVGSLGKAVRALDEKGYRTKDRTNKKGVHCPGTRFTKSTLIGYLRNPVYIGKVRYNGEVFDGLHQGIIDPAIFEQVQSVLDQNRATRTGYRAGGNRFLLQKLIKCGLCNVAMVPSTTVRKGKRYEYYRCVIDMDSYRGKCKIGAVNARHVENLVLAELGDMGESPDLQRSVVEEAAKQNDENLGHMTDAMKSLQEQLNQTTRRASNLVAVLAEAGPGGQENEFILNDLKKLQDQKSQLVNAIESLDIEISQLKTRILDGEVLLKNLRNFGAVYNQMTQEEKYDLLHFLIKKVVYFSGPKDDRGNSEGTVDLEFWGHIPKIALSKSTNSASEGSGDHFAECHAHGGEKARREDGPGDVANRCHDPLRPR
jgi:hypothetical protein